LVASGLRQRCPTHAASMEPSSERAAAALQAGAEAVAPRLEALLGDQELLPQQALGALNFVTMVLNDLLAQLTDPEAFSKYRRLKLAAVRKKAPHKPQHVEALLEATGFVPAPAEGGGQPEHLEWGPDEATALAPSLAALVLIGRVVAKGETTAGRRALSEPIDGRIRPQDVLQLRYSREHLLESLGAGPVQVFGGAQKAGTSKGALVRREWLQARLPQIAPMLDDSLSENLRERAAASAVLRTLNEVRAREGQGEASKLAAAPLLREAAQIVASMALKSLRRPEMREQPMTPAEEALKEHLERKEAERAAAAAAGEAAEGGEQQQQQPPSGEGGAAEDGALVAVASAGQAAGSLRSPAPLHLRGIEAVERVLMPALLECVPAFRLGLSHAATTEILYLREAPAFFTAGPRDKAFEVSMASIGEYLVTAMLKRTGTASAQLLSAEATSVGVGCAVDLSHDDKAVVCVLVA